MEIGLGAMGMASDAFWAQTPREWDARVAGFLEMHGGKDGGALTGGELQAMIDADERGEIHSYGADPPAVH